MATLQDVRRIASELPGAEEGQDGFGFSVVVKGKSKGFLWSWKERLEPKKPKVANESVLALRVPNLEAKEILLGSNPPWAVSDPHYNGYPAVLVRLDAISVTELEDLVVEAWRTTAPSEKIKAYEAKG